MADWYTTQIHFTERKPTKEELVRLNRAMQNVDGDAPTLTEHGMNYCNWRSPNISLNAVMTLITRSGFPCAGWQHPEEYDSYYYRDKEVYNPPPEDTLVDQRDIELWEKAYNLPVHKNVEDLKEKLAGLEDVVRYLESPTHYIHSVIKAVDKDSAAMLEGAVFTIESVRQAYAQKVHDTKFELVKLELELDPDDWKAQYEYKKLMRDKQ